MSSSSDNLTFIRKGQQRKEYWKRCWAYRELLYFLARRDFVVNTGKPGGHYLVVDPAPAAGIYFYGYFWRHRQPAIR